MRIASPTLLVLALACACSSTSAPAPTSSAPERQSFSAPLEPLELFEGWATCSAWSFEQRVAELSLGSWPSAALAELEAALAPQTITSVRAAVLLAHGGEASRQVLLTRLEQRALGALRESDAGDLVAASALERWNDADTHARLYALAVGPEPHPDLEVRVECGRVALLEAHGVELAKLTDFLVRVLHAGTPAELEDPIDWEPTTTLAWAKGCAAAALARRAGVPDRFQADGPFAAQIEVAGDLRTRLERQP